MPREKSDLPEEKVEISKSDLAELLRKVDALAGELASVKSEQAARIEASIPSAPPASENAPPGTMVEVGKDAFGAPIYRKVRWSKEWIAKTYPPKTFVPRRTMTVAPHGVQYSLVLDEEVTVPSIVKDYHDEVFRQEKVEKEKYRPISMEEDSSLVRAALSNPGVPAYSRVFRLASTGLAIPEQEQPEPEQKTA